MAESTTAVGTPGSAADSTTPARAPAPKDKRCQYCDQAFTSSSLGRHLDLYIKDKNPKPPDGIHNIEEIRKARGGITRRQARNSSARRESSTPAGSKYSPEDNPLSPSTRVGRPDTASSGRVRTTFNEANWHSTGVIRDLPIPSHDGSSSLRNRHDGSRTRRPRGVLEQKQKTTDAIDHAQAADLALHEVLDSISAANMRANMSTAPLDFDIFALTFPALVLRCLTPPPTLFSAQPFPAPDSWSLDAPSQAQFEALSRYLRAQFDDWRTQRAVSERRRPGSYSSNESTSGYDSGFGGRPENTHQVVQQQEEKAMRHLTDAFDHWRHLPDQQRQESWLLEVLRACSREHGKQKEMASQLEVAQQEIERLRLQVERLSSCQQPRDFILNPPSIIPMSQWTLKQLSSDLSAKISDWDYDRLLSKWTDVVQSNRRSAMSLSAQRPLPEPDRRSFSTPGNAGERMVNGSMQMRGRLPTAAYDREEELADASEAHEASEEPQPQRVPHIIMDRDRDMVDADMPVEKRAKLGDVGSSSSESKPETLAGPRSLGALDVHKFQSINALRAE